MSLRESERGREGGRESKPETGGDHSVGIHHVFMGSGDEPTRELRSPAIFTEQFMCVCLFPCCVASL